MTSLATTRAIDNTNTLGARSRWTPAILSVLGALCLLASALLISAEAAQPNSSITALDVRTGLVSAKEVATARTFQFVVTDPAALKRLQVGQALEADFQTQMVSVLGTPNRYRMVNIAPTARPLPATQGLQSALTPACKSPTTTSAAFLKLEGIEGESQDPCHKGEIELLSFQIGASNPPSALVVKQIDKASPKLWLTCASGQHVGRATITLLTSGGTQPQLLTYTLTDVTIASVNWAAGPATREEVILNFSKWEAKTENTDVVPQPSTSPRMVDIFLKLTGIQGNSQDATHPGEITVLNLTGGVIGHPASGGTFRSFGIEKNIDTASPILLMYRSTGRHISDGIITLRQQGGPDFLRYEMTDVVIAADSQVAGATQRERVSLDFAKLGMDYSASGFPAGPPVKSIQPIRTK